MKTLTTLLLTLGLCALSLPAFAGPSCDVLMGDMEGQVPEGDGVLNVLDVVAIVSAVLGTSQAEVNCAGPGCDAAVADATSGMFTQAQMDAAVATVDITSNDAEVAAAAAAAVDITSDNAEAITDALVGMFTQTQMDAAVAAVDITSDNDAAIADAMPDCDFEGGEVWDGSTCATPESSDPAPNCFLMGLCGQQGAAQFGITGPYSQMSYSDADAVGPSCLNEYGAGGWSGLWLGTSVVLGGYVAVGAHACN